MVLVQKYNLVLFEIRTIFRVVQWAYANFGVNLSNSPKLMYAGNREANATTNVSLYRLGSCKYKVREEFCGKLTHY